MFDEEREVLTVKHEIDESAIILVKCGLFEHLI